MFYPLNYQTFFYLSHVLEVYYYLFLKGNRRTFLTTGIDKYII